MCRQLRQRRGLAVHCRSCTKEQPPLAAGNAPAVQLWAAMQTQWRMGISLVGLDYTAMPPVAAWLGIDITPKLFAQIRHLEALTLERAHSKGAMSDGHTDKNRHQCQR